MGFMGWSCDEVLKAKVQVKMGDGAFSAANDLCTCVHGPSHVAI